MTTEQLRQQIIGPCTPEQKAEAREILEGMGEPVEKGLGWEVRSDGHTNIRFFAEPYGEWRTSKYPPTLSFEQFKQIVQP